MGERFPRAKRVLILLALVAAGVVLTQFAKHISVVAKQKAVAGDDCAILGARYGFAARGEEALCFKYRRSEQEAALRLSEIKKAISSQAGERTYCQVRQDFFDAVDIERWMLDDAAFRMLRIGIDDEQIRKLRLAAAGRFLLVVSDRIRRRDYRDTNCPVVINPDNFVFRRRPAAITVTEFGHIAADYEQATGALYYRRMPSHNFYARLWPEEVIEYREFQAAQEEADKAYERERLKESRKRRPGQ